MTRAHELIYHHLHPSPLSGSESHDTRRNSTDTLHRKGSHVPNREFKEGVLFFVRYYCLLVRKDCQHVTVTVGPRAAAAAPKQGTPGLDYQCRCTPTANWGEHTAAYFAYKFRASHIFHILHIYALGFRILHIYAFAYFAYVCKMNIYAFCIFMH